MQNVNFGKILCLPCFHNCFLSTSVTAEFFFSYEVTDFSTEGITNVCTYSKSSHVLFARYKNILSTRRLDLYQATLTF